MLGSELASIAATHKTQQQSLVCNMNNMLYNIATGAAFTRMQNSGWLAGCRLHLCSGEIHLL